MWARNQLLRLSASLPSGPISLYESLAKRLVKRGQDSEAVIARRIDAAREEMRHASEFDYVIMNQDFARAVDDLSAIVRASRLAASRQFVRHARIFSELTDPTR